MPVVIPVHEQHYPDKLLATRLEEYVLDDGRPPTTNRAFAKHVNGQQVLGAVIQAQGQLNLTNIDPRYFVGTCFHEAGCANEWDTEIATQSSPAGFQSVGAYQIGDEEARRYGFQLADMLDFAKATACMVQLAESNRSQLRIFARLGPSDPDPDYGDFPGGTMRAYLAIAHNHGLGYARITIAKYGMDWSAYKTRNPQDLIVAHGYGEDCVTGGPYWPAAPPLPPPGHRTLQLTQPFMTGEDVREMQRHIGAAPDGVFGPKTYAALQQWQLGHGLPGSGICDDATWAALLTT